MLLDDDDGALGLALLDEEPFLTFERVELDRQAGEASFQFHYCGGRRFRATLKLDFPAGDGGSDVGSAAQDAAIRNALVHIGLCILPWYWMGFNCRHLRVEAAYLAPEQVRFWEDFYQDVLSEFLYLHGLDRDRLQLHVCCPPDAALPVLRDRELLADGRPPKVLVPLGGGKDSLVVFQLLERTQTPCAWVHVGDRPREFQRSWRLRQIAQLTAGRTLHAEPFLLEHAMSDPAWEWQVAGNKYQPCGHPWAALVAFDSVLAAIAGGFSHIAVGNERSANYGNNVEHQGRVVNHQYDKSFHFEQRVHAYIRAYLVEDLHYFSALQHLWEVQIARTFVSRSLSGGSNFLRVFLSCNEAVDGDKWCCACSKCAFVFLLLSAWCSLEEMEDMFGENLFDKPSLFADFRALLGSDTGIKPMECVGTASEALLSLHMAAPRFAKTAFVESLDPDVVEQGRALRFLLEDYNPEHLVPEFLLSTLREPISDFS